MSNSLRSITGSRCLCAEPVVLRSLLPGAHYWNMWLKIEAMHAAMDQRLQSGPAEVGGPLKLAASTTIAQYLLPRWLGRFQQQHPRVELSLRMGNTEEVTPCTLR